MAKIATTARMVVEERGRIMMMMMVMMKEVLGVLNIGFVARVSTKNNYERSSE